MFFWHNSPHWTRASSFMRFSDHTQNVPKSVRLLWTSDQPIAETSKPSIKPLNLVYSL